MYCNTNESYKMCILQYEPGTTLYESVGWCNMGRSSGKKGDIKMSVAERQTVE